MTAGTADILRKARHTEGPWNVDGEIRPVADCYRLYCADIRPALGKYRGSVASVQSCAHIDGISNAEAEANAHLLAAAPEMYRALQEIMEQAQGEQDGFYYETARKAIELAEAQS